MTPRDLYFSHLNIPDAWDSLHALKDWYLEQRMPMIIPEGSPVYVTNNATAIVLFRRGNFQVELYITHGEEVLSDHSHPRMEVLTMPIGGCDNNIWGVFSPVLVEGQSHSAAFDEGGLVFLTFEKWENKAEMTSAAVNWKGETSGDVHDALIRKYHPNAVVHNNYADVT